MTNNSSEKGFTMVEVLIAIALAVVLFYVMTTLGMSIFQYSTTTRNSLSAQQDARQILRQFVSEVRTAVYSANGAYYIDTADATTFTFYSDMDNDGSVEKVSYYLSGTNLMKSVIRPTGNPAVYTSAPTIYTLMRDIAPGITTVFSYYDGSYSGSGSALAQPVDVSAVRLVKFDISIEKDPNRAPSPIVVTTQVALRNLKDNL